MHCTTLHYTAQHCTAQQCTARHTALHYTTAHYTALDCTALALHCTAGLPPGGHDLLPDNKVAIMKEQVILNHCHRLSLWTVISIMLSPSLVSAGLQATAPCYTVQGAWFVGLSNVQSTIITAVSCHSPSCSPLVISPRPPSL